MIRNDRPFDQWIKAQPGRCRTCGFHPPTQGHDPDCLDGRRALKRPPARAVPSGSSWSDREESTWIDRM